MRDQFIPRRLKYDTRLFHQWNFQVRVSINAYDADIIKNYGPDQVEHECRECEEPGCDTRVAYYRLRLCERHRLQHRKLSKHRKRST